MSLEMSKLGLNTLNNNTTYARAQRNIQLDIYAVLVRVFAVRKKNIWTLATRTTPSEDSAQTELMRLLSIPKRLLYYCLSFFRLCDARVLVVSVALVCQFFIEGSDVVV